MSLKEKIYNELKSCPSLQAMIDTLQDATTPGGSLTPGWLTKKFGRGEPMTFEQADNWKTNPKFQEDVENGYDTNCMTTVIAFEARLRGYDVEARPYSQRDLGTTGTPIWLASHIGEFFSKVNVQVQTNYFWTSPSKTIKSLDSLIGMKQRYFLGVGWAKKRYEVGARSGHALFAYKDDLGNLIVYCPQTNKVYDDRKKLMELFKRVAYTRAYTGRKQLDVMYARIDNIPFNAETMGELFNKAGEKNEN